MRYSGIGLEPYTCRTASITNQCAGTRSMYVKTLYGWPLELVLQISMTVSLGPGRHHFMFFWPPLRSMTYLIDVSWEFRGSTTPTARKHLNFLDKEPDKMRIMHQVTLDFT